MSVSSGALLTRQVGLAGLFDELGLARRGRQAQCPAPEHAQSGRTPPVSLDEDRGLWFCHGCGAGGSGVELLGLVRGLDVRSALLELERRAGVVRVVPSSTSAPAGVEDVDRCRPIDGGRGERLLRRYVDRRGWCLATVETFGLSAVVDPWGRARVRHPYRVGGHVRWWQDRAVDPSVAPRWMSPKGMRRWLYAGDLLGALDVRQGEVLLVVEGPADVISMWHALGDQCHVVGLPGTAGVERFAPMFQGLSLALALDADTAGDGAAARLAELVSGQTVRVRPPSGLDVSEWRLESGDEAVRAEVLGAVGHVGRLRVGDAS